MPDFLLRITSGEYLSLFLYLIGAVFIYINRFQLLYENGSMSLGRTWSWILFYLAVAYWIRYLIGSIPDSKPFPPALENMLYAVLLYEFARRDNGILKTIMSFVLAIRGTPPPHEWVNDRQWEEHARQHQHTEHAEHRPEHVIPRVKD